MPWSVYANITSPDAPEIAAYFKSLVSARHQVLRNVASRQKPPAEFLHFRVCQSKP
jgi:hypothetical protein